MAWKERYYDAAVLTVTRQITDKGSLTFYLSFVCMFEA